MSYLSWGMLSDQGLEAAVQELWKRRNIADRDLIASLRAAAGLPPIQEEIFARKRTLSRVSYERDTKIINAASFTIEREEHTIGNIIRMQLHRDENVLFAGYKLPHPLQYKIIVRVGFQSSIFFPSKLLALPVVLLLLLLLLQIHTTSQSSPMQAYNQAINDLDRELDHLKNAFEVCGDGEVFKGLLMYIQDGSFSL
ncbi:hypothetical protein Ahy_A03g015966 isoform D [Arachis hypogaea]|uniref:DNA-directed RNA polymerase RBP11-like dimerisation domain-containing protein n=1 Tax=Arachis hypogaea TaxID=3818 RepID=A0A445E1X7_ARAHY|nr:hypothetical protein Ahy_A03g015966 isoform D [Arachis hypogaea]